jgi:endonuclease III related protein
MSHPNTHTRLEKGTSPLVAKVYNLLYKAHGPQGWWPAPTPFEVAIGAILTQNTSWSNVEKAIKGLKKKKLLTPAKLQKATLKKIAAAIKPCGYYNIKAGRLKNFTHFLFQKYKGRIENMKLKNTALLRKELLSVNGIGPETCDSILLYALNKPFFVVDAYTRRIAECLSLAEKTHDYNFVQSVFADNLPKDFRLFNEYHALIVRHAKEVCRKKPACPRCILRKLKGQASVIANPRRG